LRCQPEHVISYAASDPWVSRRRSRSVERPSSPVAISARERKTPAGPKPASSQPRLPMPPSSSTEPRAGEVRGDAGRLRGFQTDLIELVRPPHGQVQKIAWPGPSSPLHSSTRCQSPGRELERTAGPQQSTGPSSTDGCTTGATRRTPAQQQARHWKKPTLTAPVFRAGIGTAPGVLSWHGLWPAAARPHASATRDPLLRATGRPNAQRDGLEISHGCWAPRHKGLTLTQNPRTGFSSFWSGGQS